MSTLYVVATPIGNLGDITLRAIEILKTVQLVAAEDTRMTRKLLNHIGSKAKTLSYNENSAPSRLKELLRHLDTGDLAVVTDAGTPAVSDPGSELVREAAATGHDVVPVPGASSVSAALSVTGFDSTAFAFLGFLPRKKTRRIRALQSQLRLPMSLVFFESPHRVRRTLEDVAQLAAERQIVICRELTKLHQEIFRGTAHAALEHFTEPRGEFVIVVAPAPPADATITDDEITPAAEKAIADGLRGRSAIERVIAETGAPRARVYSIVISLQPEE